VKLAAACKPPRKNWRRLNSAKDMCELYNLGPLTSQMLLARASLSVPYAVGLLTFLAALLWGQSPAAGPAAPPVKKPALSDAELESAIRRRFEHSKIGANGFSVRVHNGVAILEGRTDVPQHKGTATRLARNAGARRVDNRIEVSREARQVRSAPRRVQVRRSEPR